ncbi:MAG: 23S rRNA pseudouridine1911/1915/1917 synthase [Pseudohongiellaceae bacterium]|jgi:23S rRNA pseudouridine1911/1915/1917 synthase
MASPSLNILHRDEFLLGVCKPAGLPTVPDDSRDLSLYDQVRRLLMKEGGADPFVGIVQRLDRPVSGVLVLALRKDSAAKLSEQLRGRKASKVYWGVCEGIPNQRSGKLTQWLLKDSARNLVRSVSEGRGGAKQAVTDWKVLSTLGDRALLELRPQTGRSHQLRVAASKLGCPFVGDVKYGASRQLKDLTIGLHARQLSLRHPGDSQRLTLEAPLPEVPLWNLGRRYAVENA